MTKDCVYIISLASHLEEVQLISTLKLVKKFFLLSSVSLHRAEGKEVKKAEQQ